MPMFYFIFFYIFAIFYLIMHDQEFSLRQVYLEFRNTNEWGVTEMKKAFRTKICPLSAVNWVHCTALGQYWDSNSDLGLSIYIDKICLTSMKKEPEVNFSRVLFLGIRERGSRTALLITPESVRDGLNVS